MMTVAKPHTVSELPETTVILPVNLRGNLMVFIFKEALLSVVFIISKDK